MEEKFWHSKWQNKEIAFHEKEINPVLTRHFHELSLTPNANVFVPLCGKTLDIGWLLSRGYKVSGVELSHIAIKELFEELGVFPSITDAGALKKYSAKNIDIYGGNFFDLTSKILGNTDAIYDRAALVALPPEMRSRYTEHLMNLTNRAPQLLICFEYDQSTMKGPPFSVPRDAVQEYYSNHYNLSVVENEKFPGGLKGNQEVRQIVWLLK